MIELINMANWPVWAQIPGMIIGLYGLYKLVTAPYWGPAT